MLSASYVNIERNFCHGDGQNRPSHNILRSSRCRTKLKYNFPNSEFNRAFSFQLDTGSSTHLLAKRAFISVI